MLGKALSLAAAGNAGGEETDPNFNQTVLLLHGDGTNGAQNNTFLDSSTNNFTITRNGNTTQGTFSPFSAPDGRWSNYFDGTGDYLSLADNAAFTLGSSDFTIECWLYNTTTSAREFFAGQIDSGGTNASASFFMQKSSTNKLIGSVCSGSTAYQATSTNDLPSNQWVHIALVRDGNTLRQYINGVQDGTASVTGVTVNNSTQIFAVGRAGALALDEWTGYISNFRQVVGTCLYTGGTTFTPPTTPLTNITNTSLLTCQSNRFVDNSTNAFAITRNGDVKVTPFSPFAPTAAYDASVNGASAYLDGTGDYLTAPDDADFEFGSSNFTLEAWIYQTGGVGGTRSIFAKRISDAVYGGYDFFIDSLNNLRAIADDNTSSPWAVNFSGGSIASNEWTHVALTRSGSTWTLWKNGVSAATATSSITINNQATNVGIGAIANGQQTFTGYIAGARILNGTAIDFASTGIPTAPPTNITNTSLLLNFTNAGIFDNTGKNNLETVADAQIDTTTKKFGTGSLEFDGSGDYLLLPASENFVFGTGNFTVEFWMNATTVNSTFRRIVTNVTGGVDANTLLIRLNNTNKIQVYFTTTDIIGATTISTGTWYHIAVVRNGGSCVLYVNGSSDASTTDTGNINKTTMTIGGHYNNSSEFYHGFIDDLRITKGVARYTSNFTPPTAAFPNL